MSNYDKKINQLINLYTQAEKRLINIISTKTIKGQVTDFYKGLLKQIRIELAKLQIQSVKLSKDIVDELYREAYENTMKDIGEDIKGSFSKLHTDAINTLTDNLINNFAEVNNQVGRKIEDTIREIGLTNAQVKFATGQTIKQLQKELGEALVNEGIGGITDKRGRVIPFTVYAELLARSIIAETQNTSVMNVAFEHGHDLVKMTEHKTSCPVCQKYEGRVYSITGHDERFPELDTIPGFNKGYNNIHPRCRHRISVYIEKYNYDDENKLKHNDKLVVSKDKSNDILSNKKWLKSEFATQKKFDKHIEKHINEYSNISPQEYLNIARKLLAEPLSDDVEGFISEIGFIFKYRKSTNDFVIGRYDGYISTLYKPKLGYEQWLLEIKKYKKEK